MAKKGRPKGIWSPEIVKQRISITKIAKRLNDHILGLDRQEEVYHRILTHEGQVVMDEDGKPKRYKAVRSKAMTAQQVQAAIALLGKILPNAEAPKDINLTGNITVIRRDPTHRTLGYHRKGRATIKGEH